MSFSYTCQNCQTVYTYKNAKSYQGKEFWCKRCRNVTPALNISNTNISNTINSSGKGNPKEKSNTSRNSTSNTKRYTTHEKVRKSDTNTTEKVREKGSNVNEKIKAGNARLHTFFASSSSFPSSPSSSFSPPFSSMQVLSSPKKVCEGSEFLVKYRGQYYRSRLEAALFAPLSKQEAKSFLLSAKGEGQRKGQQQGQRQGQRQHQRQGQGQEIKRQKETGRLYVAQGSKYITSITGKKKQQKQKKLTQRRIGSGYESLERFAKDFDSYMVDFADGAPFVSPKKRPVNRAIKEIKNEAEERKRRAAESNISYVGGGGYGCFAGNSKILMASGQVKLAKNIEVGDLIKTENGKSARVEGKYIQQPCSWKFDLFKIGNLLISSPHLMKMDGHWMKPRNIPHAIPVSESIPLYNFIIEGRQSMIVEDMILSSVGQFCQGYHDPSRKVVHKLWASEGIVNLLKHHPQWPAISFPSNSNFFQYYKDPAIVKKVLSLFNRKMDTKIQETHQIETAILNERILTIGRL